jgi:RNA polymerase sigma-70 factor (ECF subfamily)
MATSETTGLLERWHDGDNEALNHLIDLHLPWLRTCVRDRLGPTLRLKLDSGDVVQEALLDFLKYGPRFKPRDGNQFRALMARIITNTLCDESDRFMTMRRDLAREHPLSTSVSLDLAGGRMDSPDEAVARAEEEARVRLVVELLTPADRTVVVLRNWDRLSFEEIAQRVGCTADTARMRYHRAHKKLRAGLSSLRAGEVDELLGATEG